jgi:hypothetical protein
MTRIGVIKKCALLLAVGTMVLTTADRGWAAPTPGASAANWEIDFEYRDLERIVVQQPGDDAPQVYWYMIYTATNNTGAEIDFIPSFEIVTDTLRRSESSVGVPAGVFEIIKKRHKEVYPLLMSPLKSFGRLLRGVDNAKDSVAIWRQFDLNANRASVYVNGLSGERLRVSNPAWRLQQSGARLSNLPEIPQFITLKKTLKVDYRVPGDAETRRESAEAQRTKQSWVMR